MRYLNLLLLLCFFFPTPLLAEEAAEPSVEVIGPPSPPSRAPVNAPAKERIDALKKIAIYYYWYGGDIGKAEKEIFKGITLRGKYDLVEGAFREAITIDPYDLDLRFSLASSLLVQNKVTDALTVYRQILGIKPDNFNANLLYGLYSKLKKDDTTYNIMLERLMKIDPEKTQEYLERFRLTERFIHQPLSTAIPSTLSKTGHAVVILGYALAKDGSMQDPLIDRLETGLAIAKQYPDSKILLSGIEANAMKKWLLRQNVQESHIIVENKSKDTVENALYSTIILEKEQLYSVTIVTSASHMRRAVNLFRIATVLSAKAHGSLPSRAFTHVSYLDYPTLEEAQVISEAENFAIYRDLLRISGIWQYPGMQR